MKITTGHDHQNSTKNFYQAIYHVKSSIIYTDLECLESLTLQLLNRLTAVRLFDSVSAAPIILKKEAL